MKQKRVGHIFQDNAMLETKLLLKVVFLFDVVTIVPSVFIYNIGNIIVKRVSRSKDVKEKSLIAVVPLYKKLNLINDG